MAVNARTFQVLYIVRQRALDDRTTTLEDISDFIADRRKTAPNTYDKAYISPSALLQMLQRMTTNEGLLTLGLSQDREYEFTPIGSQMADLLTGFDACSSAFLNDYKAKVCLAALQQRQRLEQKAPISPREAAVIANISLDSARRGLAELAERGLATEDRDGRTSLYSLPEAGEARPPDEDSNETTASTNIDPEYADIFDGIDDDDSEWFRGKSSKNPDPDDLVNIGAILRDEPHEDPVPEFESPAFDKTEDNEQGQPNDPYLWENVPVDTRDGIILRAKAAGMSLNKFLFLLNLLHTGQIQKALFGEQSPS